MTLTKEFIDQTKKAYKNIARLEIDGDKLVIRDTQTNRLHPFRDGRQFVKISETEKIKIYEWL